jgi:hypothetical protein
MTSNRGDAAQEETMSATKPKPIGFRRAMDIMRRSEVRLVQMHGPLGALHYLVPGGHIAPDIAEKIKQHPLVRSGADGLFPQHAQTWRLMRQPEQKGR